MTTLKASASRQSRRFKKWMFTPKTFAGGLGRLFIGLTVSSLPVSMLQFLTGCGSEEAAKQPAVEQVQSSPSPVASPSPSPLPSPVASPSPSPIASPSPEQAQVEEPIAPPPQGFREPEPNPEPVDEPVPITPQVRTSGNCSSFASHAEAQASLEAGNSKLDRDKDGVACESLL